MRYPEAVIERDLTELEEEKFSSAHGCCVGAPDVAQLVGLVESVLPAPRTRAECNEQRTQLTCKVERLVCDVDGALVLGKIDRLVELKQLRTAQETCSSSHPTTNPYQRSAAKWLANEMGLPACVAPVSTEAEYELFMSLYMKLSKQGRCGVSYQQMCTEWNNIVVAEMKEIQAASSDVEVDKLFDQLRLKTSCQLAKYASVLTDRWHGVTALKPYLAEYKRLCHDLKQPNADDVLATPQVGCTATTPQAGPGLEETRTVLPMPSSFAMPSEIRKVIIRSKTLEAAGTNTSKRVHSPRAPPSHQKKPKLPKHGKQKWKMELCSQCYIRHKSLEVVYVEFEDGKSEEIHSARQYGRYPAKCKKFVSALNEQEKVAWKLALQTMKRNGKWEELYEATKASYNV